MKANIINDPNITADINEIFQDNYEVDDFLDEYETEKYFEHGQDIDLSEETFDVSH